MSAQNFALTPAYISCCGVMHMENFKWWWHDNILWYDTNISEDLPPASSSMMHQHISRNFTMGTQKTQVPVQCLSMYQSTQGHIQKIIILISCSCASCWQILHVLQ
jgi:hypothetical protein